MPNQPLDQRFHEVLPYVEGLFPHDGNIETLRERLAILLALSNGPWVYRGLPDTSYCLTPSIARLDTNECKEIDPAKEEGVLRNFRKYYTRDLSPTMDIRSRWLWMALAQHYGAPTRLMDWSYSMLVALTFTSFNEQTSLEKDRDATLWCVNVVNIRGHLLALKDYMGSWLGKYISDGAKHHGPWTLHLEKLEEYDHAYSSDAEKNAIPWTRNDGTTHSRFFHDFLLGEDDFRRNPALIFFEPPSIDGRISAQAAVFSVASGLDQDIEKLLMRLQWQSSVGTLETDGPSPSIYSNILAQNSFPAPLRKDAIFYRITIPARFRPLIRGTLFNNNLNEKMMFPDPAGLGIYVKKAWRNDVFGMK